MVKIGYKLSSEEHPAPRLVENARLAEESGFSFALISDHFHPWIDRQGQSPFVWGVLGAIANATARLEVGTGVTCPTIRIHPAIIAQAAATAAQLMPGRFFLGLGSGENLNEHILGDKWPPVDTRQQMLEEAVEIIRLLWRGGEQSFDGDYFVVENARVYSLPDELPPIHLAAGGEQAAELAGRIGDGFVGTSPKKETIDAFRKAGGKGKPTYGEMSVCWADSQRKAVKTVSEWWPTAAIPGQLGQELALPAHFEQVTPMVTEDMLAEQVTCGPDPQRHIEAISKYVDAGYDHICVHQIGPDQEGFFDFYRREVLPAFERAAVGSRR
jgi:coenzyme F420-dependent glucose-6-phosphate dehydrogenase